MILIFKLFVFSHLSYLSILLLGSILWENWFVVVDTTKSCKPSILCDIPLVRVDSGGCVGISLSEEVIVVVWL